MSQWQKFVASKFHFNLVLIFGVLILDDLNWSPAGFDFFEILKLINSLTGFIFIWNLLTNHSPRCALWSTWYFEIDVEEFDGSTIVILALFQKFLDRPCAVHVVGPLEPDEIHLLVLRHQKNSGHAAQVIVRLHGSITQAFQISKPTQIKNWKSGRNTDSETSQTWKVDLIEHLQNNFAVKAFWLLDAVELLNIWKHLEYFLQQSWFLFLLQFSISVSGGHSLKINFTSICQLNSHFLELQKLLLSQGLELLQQRPDVLHLAPKFEFYVILSFHFLHLDGILS